jgi:hypothetical protein
MREYDDSILNNDFMKSAERQLEALKARDEEVGRQITELRAEHRILRSKVHALENLLGIDNRDQADAYKRSSTGLSSAHANAGAEALIVQNAEIHPSDTPSAVDIAAEILSERSGEPMHYRDLADEVLLRGGLLPETSAPTTLNGRINRDDRFVRPFRRGFYALKKDHPNVRNSVGARRRSSRI